MDGERRKKRLSELLERMKLGEDIAQRDLKNVLTEDAYRELQEMWSHQRAIRALRKPPKIEKYEQLLKVALLAESKAEHYSMSRKRKEHVAHELRNGAENACERAAEYLEYHRSRVFQFT